ncbi:MAG: NAD(P)-dependent oxidoreductase, partial [Acidilobaceae archaeon]
AVGKVDAVLAFLADDEAVMTVASMIPRADGLIFSNFSTVTPRASVQVSEFLKARGVCYVETPVVGGPQALREGKAVILVSGPVYCVRGVRGAINALASDVFDISEDIGKAAALKLAYNNLLITTVASLAESMVLAESYGVNVKTFFELLSKTMFREMAERYYNRLVAEDAPVGFRLALAAKDLDYARRAAGEKGLTVFTASNAEQLYRIASAMGYGDKDYSRIYMFLKKIRGYAGI